MKQCKIYDNGGDSFDRFTAIFLCDPERQKGFYSAFAMSARPFSPNGFGQWTTAMDGNHLGKRIDFDKLPLDCQNALSRIAKYNYPKIKL